MMTKRLGILGSTRGTNLVSIVEAIQAQRLAATIEVVISNKTDAFILERAKNYGLTAKWMDPLGLTREKYDEQVSALLQAYRIDYIILIGYMRILSAPFVTMWRDRIINVHPSLLPAFSGLMDLDVHRAALASGHPQTGCSVHYVTEEVDAGPIILQKTCQILSDDTAQSLKERVQSLEGEALVEAIALL